MAGKKSSKRELNVLLLGETGVGKSTWINGFVNYLSFCSLDEAERNDVVAAIPTTFTVGGRIVTTGSDDNEVQDVGESCTQMPQTYVFAGRNVTVRLIDTPGLGDTRGVERDRENLQYILQHIASFEELHGICILLKPNNARLNVMFAFVVKEMVTHLHRSACRNIVFCFTNTRGTFYRPGDTLPALRALLSRNPNIDIQLNSETIYCIDNEGMRYLYAVKNGVRFIEDEKKEFAASYDKSVEVFAKWLRHVSALKPHPIMQTLSLNDARRMIVVLQRPLAEISATIQRNIAARLEAEEKLAEKKNKGKLVSGVIQFPQIVIETVALARPRIICAKCNPNGDDRTVPDCKTLKKTFFGKVAAAFGQPRLCKQCQCPPRLHMEMTYDIRQVEVMENAFDINKMEQDLRELREEQKLVIRYGAQFACFLQKNSIAAYNDALDDYFERIIIVEKEKTKVSRQRLENLESVRKKYREETKALNESLSDPRSKVSPLTSLEIQELIDKLKAMKHTGPMLSKVVKIAEEAEDQARKHKEIQINVNIKTAHLNPLQLLFNGES